MCLRNVVIFSKMNIHIFRKQLSIENMTILELSFIFIIIHNHDHIHLLIVTHV